MTEIENTNTTVKRVYVTGNRPENPIILDVVYLIDDIRKEDNTLSSFASEQVGESEQPEMYSYVVTAVLTFAEYLKQLKAEMDATVEELDAAIFELDAGGV